MRAFLLTVRRIENTEESLASSLLLFWSSAMAVGFTAEIGSRRRRRGRQS
jgi:hypothetical protein